MASSAATAEEKLYAERAAELLDKYLRFGKASTFIPDNDLTHGGEVWKLVEIVRAHLEQSWYDVISAADNSPLLQSYSSDATPKLTRRQFSAELSDHKRIRKEFAEGVEYLLQVGWLRTTDKSGQPIQTVLMKESVPLHSGEQSAAHEFQALMDFVEPARMLGHTGVYIEHVCFDRKFFASLQRMARQRSELYYSVLRGVKEADPTTDRLQMGHITLATACSCHDIQNALKWSLSPVADSGIEVVKSLHIVIESVRNGFDLVFARLPAFVAGTLLPTDEPVDAQALYEYYTCLGVDNDTAVAIADYGLRWEGGFLKAYARKCEAAGAVGQIVDIVMAVFTFRSFTDSRWCTIGGACRTLIASLSLGLENVIGRIRADKACSDYYIGGFARLSPHVLKYAATAAASAHVSDAVLAELLEDDRLAVRAPYLVSLMREEMDYLQLLSPTFWHLLSAASNCPTDELKDSVFKAAHVQCAFFHMRAIKMALQYPWKLCAGDVSENLDDLLKA